MTTIGKLIQPPVFPQIGPVTSGELSSSRKTTGAGETQGSFGDMLASGIKEVDAQLKEYDALSNAFAKGGAVNIHEIILKGEQADINLRMMAAIKTKVLEAYQEVMRMNI